MVGRILCEYDDRMVSGDCTGKTVGKCDSLSGAAKASGMGTQKDDSEGCGKLSHYAGTESLPEKPAVKKKRGCQKKYLTPAFACVKVSKVIDVEEKLEQTYLYDFYGELLNEHQSKIYEDFVFNDLSLRRDCFGGRHQPAGCGMI